ncbi:DUF5018 domain-containing protein [Bacteroides thetaiotaomicron]|nr:DUF5018 domain-containing protein [Bacteroides thetaiotaomicron]
MTKQTYTVQKAVPDKIHMDIERQ